MTDAPPTESDLNDLVAFLRAKWDEQEAEATAVLAEAQRFYPASEGFTVRYDWAVATSHRSGGYGVLTRRGAPSPQDMLADIAAKRQVLQLLIDEPHLVIDQWNLEECFYTCAAAIEDTAIEDTAIEDYRTDDLRHGAPCDCGRDRRLETVVRLFAAAYPDHVPAG